MSLPPLGDRLRRAARWLVATPERSGSHWLTRFLFLRLLGLVYLFAFLSLAHQVRPLFGEGGLLPARLFLDRVIAREGSTLEAFWHRPTLFFIDSSDIVLEGTAWVGVALSALVLAGFADALRLSVLWLLYLSFVHIGQDFYAFGWESQLLETGLLAVFLCPLLDARPFPRRPPPRVVVWLFRWLVVRIMLGAGFIKMRGDPCWRDLTCLCFHYETQPVPNPLSPLLHHMPVWFHELECIFNHVVELAAPVFAFGPPRLRRLSGVLFIAFQGMLILSGNLSFLNHLTLCPAIFCLDDGLILRAVPRRVTAFIARVGERASPSRPQVVISMALGVVVAVLSVEPVVNLLSPRQLMNASFNRFHFVNTYGAFGRVGRERYEIIIEGTSDPDPAAPGARWRAYEFKVKPGDPARRPPVVAPYHYRVDWQIWFAAGSSPGRHPWLVHLIWKLLQNDRLALTLLDGNPFPDAPPRFIRADLYRYRFAPPSSGVVWSRERVRPWLRPLSLEDDELRRFLVAYGWLDPAEVR